MDMSFVFNSMMEEIFKILCSSSPENRPTMYPTVSVSFATNGPVKSLIGLKGKRSREMLKINTSKPSLIYF